MPDPDWEAVAGSRLEAGRVPAQPFSLMCRWLDHAVAAGVSDPTAAVLATVNEDGRPSTRAIEVKGCDARGLVFFANLRSRKGQDLRANPAAAVTLYWPELMRQINIGGDIRFTADEESDRLWDGRGLAGQAVACVSEQGAPLRDESMLRARAGALVEAGQKLSRPADHGGFILAPVTVEFWQGNADRFHRRLHYGRDGDRWSHWLLQP